MRGIVYPMRTMKRRGYWGIVTGIGLWAGVTTVVMYPQEARADVRVYRDARGVLHITNVSKATARAQKGRKRPSSRVEVVSLSGGSLSFPQQDSFVASPSTRAAIQVYRDPRGVLHFTNAPNRPGYRPFLLLRNYASRLNGKNSAEFDRLIRAACRRYGVEFALVKAVIKAESSFNPTAISPAGARGLMQLMPQTAALHGVEDIHDPRDNIEGGVRHLRLLLDQFAGDLSLVLAAYNAGAGAVMRYNGIPPYQETQEYVRRVLQYREAYQSS